MKTGFTNKSKYSLVATAERGNTHLIAVVLGAENKDVRADVAKRMLDLGFSKSGQKTATVKTVPVPKNNPVTRYAQDYEEYNEPVVWGNEKTEITARMTGEAGVQFGAFSQYGSAQRYVKQVNDLLGVKPEIVYSEENRVYRVRVNGLSEQSAQNLKNLATQHGLDCYIFH
jgi:D-alanyl-D-alanine carboxypeptidase